MNLGLEQTIDTTMDPDEKRKHVIVASPSAGTASLEAVGRAMAGAVGTVARHGAGRVLSVVSGSQGGDDGEQGDDEGISKEGCNDVDKGDGDKEAVDGKGDGGRVDGDDGGDCKGDGNEAVDGKGDNGKGDDGDGGGGGDSGGGGNGDGGGDDGRRGIGVGRRKILIAAGSVVLGAGVVGFGGEGVVSGSIAAVVHSMIGNVAAGSLLASLTGLGLTETTVARLFGGTAGAAAGVGAEAAYGAVRGNGEREDVGGNDRREGECSERKDRREG